MPSKYTKRKIGGTKHKKTKSTKKTLLSHSREESKELFDIFDTANNGIISKKEFKTMLDRKLPSNKIDRMFKEIDTGKEGYITPEEFHNAFTKLKKMFPNFKSASSHSKVSMPRPKADRPRMSMGGTRRRRR